MLSNHTIQSCGSNGLQDLNQLEEDKKRTVLDMIDTYIRDHKARQAYSA